MYVSLLNIQNIENYVAQTYRKDFMQKSQKIKPHSPHHACACVCVY